MALYLFEDWQLDTARQTLRQGSKAVPIEYRLLQLLQLFCENPHTNLSKDQILQYIWAGKVVSDDTIYVSINQLRKILQDSSRQPRLIQTVPGVGYRFIGELKTLSREPRPLRWTVVAGMVLMLIASAITWQRWQAPTPPLPPESISDDFRRARFLLTREAEAEAVKLLEAIVAREPQFAPAHIELATIYLTRLMSPHSPALAEPGKILHHIDTALHYAPDNPQGRLVAGNYAFWVDWDIAAAEVHYRRALGTAQGHHAYAQLLLAKADFAAAREQVVQYQLLDPSGYSQPAVAWIANLSGDSHRALRELQAIATLQADSYYYRQSLQATYELLGQHQRAYAELRWLMAHAGYSVALLEDLDDIFAREGLSGVYHWLAFVDTEQRDIGQYTPPLSLARYAAKANAPERAILWLQQALALHQTQLLWLAVDPAYASLRNHPKFADITRKLGL